MTNAVTVSGSTYIVRGYVHEQTSNQPVVGIHVIAYGKNLFQEEEFLAITTTGMNGGFEASFEASTSLAIIGPHQPDISFSVMDGGTEVLNTKGSVLWHAGPESTAKSSRIV